MINTEIGVDMQLFWKAEIPANQKDTRCKAGLLECWSIQYNTEDLVIELTTYTYKYEVPGKHFGSMEYPCKQDIIFRVAGCRL